MKHILVSVFLAAGLAVNAQSFTSGDTTFITLTSWEQRDELFNGTWGFDVGVAHEDDDAVTDFYCDHAKTYVIAESAATYVFPYVVYKYPYANHEFKHGVWSRDPRYKAWAEGLQKRLRPNDPVR